jgi:phenylpropionate dioxygenase-like ring-hydroxylating dioxygenase large terminal subunit
MQKYDSDVSGSSERIISSAIKSIRNAEMPLKVFHDPGVHQLELERIFPHCWVFVGHESEISKPGDYCLRYIGEDQFVLVRDESGRVNVLFNSCRHRGTAICRVEMGNTSHFRCPYHGWTYSNNGKLVGVPMREAGYPSLDFDKLGLLKARVGVYDGLIFACLEDDTPPLEEYLGGSKWYIDFNLKLTDMEVLGPPERWLVDYDWKVAMDNFAGDSYHTPVTHKSIIDLNLAHPLMLQAAGHSPYDVHVSEIDEVSTISIRQTPPENNFFWGYSPNIVSKFKRDNVSPAQWDIARRAVVNVSHIFPNFAMMQASGVDSVGGQGSGFLALYQFQPRGVGRMEAWTWILAPRGASEEEKRLIYSVAIKNTGPSGHVMMDDLAVWNGIGLSAKSVFAVKKMALFNLQLGSGKIAEGKFNAKWPGPGRCVNTNLEEGVQRTFWKRWVKEIASE